MGKKLVIIPTYNEAQNIGNLVREILALPGDFRILVVDDNSPDGTAGIVERLPEVNGRVHLIKRNSKMGLAGAYLEGFRWSLEKGFDFVFTMDADYSHQPKYLVPMSESLLQYDMAVGSRYIRGGGIQGWPVTRKLLSGMGNLYARKITRLPIKDCTSGFIALRRQLVEDILKENIGSEGYAFHIEIKNLARCAGYSIKEVPILFIDRKVGKSKISRRIIGEALVRVWKFRFKYRKAVLRGNKLFKSLDRYLGIPMVWFLGLFVKRNPELPARVNSILVIKLSALGDTVLLIPVLRNLRQKYPDARISVVGTKINREILMNCPYIDKAIIVEMKDVLAKPLSVYRMLRGVKAELALDFDQWLRLSPLLAIMSEAKTRIGFKTRGQGRHFAHTHWTEHKRDVHEIDNFMNIIRPLGIEAKERSLEFRVSNEDRQKAADVLYAIGINEADRFIVFHPETPLHGGQRQWPLESYMELGRALIEKNNAVKIVISGTKKELASNKIIAHRLRPHAYVLPEMNIAQVAAVFQRSKMLVCGNTGVMHLACAVGVPVVALHGPTNPGQWGPLGPASRVVKSNVSCSPCLYLGFEYGCVTNRCMRAITTKDVFEAVASLDKN